MDRIYKIDKIISPVYLGFSGDSPGRPHGYFQFSISFTYRLSVFICG